MPFSTSRAAARPTEAADPPPAESRSDDRSHPCPARQGAQASLRRRRVRHARQSGLDRPGAGPEHPAARRLAFLSGPRADGDVPRDVPCPAGQSLRAGDQAGRRPEEGRGLRSGLLRQSAHRALGRAAVDRLEGAWRGGVRDRRTGPRHRPYPQDEVPGLRRRHRATRFEGTRHRRGNRRPGRSRRCARRTRRHRRVVVALAAP